MATEKNKQRRRTLQRTLQLFRVWIPSWRFFDKKGDVPVLYYKTWVKGQDLAGWKNALSARPQRKFFDLLLNEEGNAFMAYHTLIQQTLDDLNEWEDDRLDHFHESVSFRLIENLVRDRILVQERYPFSITTFQFKISSTEDVLVSEVTKW